MDSSLHTRTHQGTLGNRPLRAVTQLGRLCGPGVAGNQPDCAGTGSAGRRRASATPTPPQDLGEMKGRLGGVGSGDTKLAEGPVGTEVPRCVTASWTSHSTRSESLGQGFRNHKLKLCPGPHGLRSQPAALILEMGHSASWCAWTSDERCSPEATLTAPHLRTSCGCPDFYPLRAHHI